MGNTMRLGCRRTFFRKPDCLTSKLYGHSILSWLIIYSLALLNLVCIETQPIDATIQKQFLTQLCYLELYVLGSLCSCCTAFQNVAFVQLNFGASPLLLTISRSCLIQNYYAHCNLEYCMKFLGMDVLHMQMSVIVIDTRFAINLSFKTSCYSSRILQTLCFQLIIHFFCLNRSIPLLFPCLKMLVFILLAVMKVEIGWRY